MATHNGHKNRAHWNVALWLFNDEWLYNLVMGHLRRAKNKDEAARAIVADLPEKTPDGARYTFGAVRAALVGV